MTGADARGGGVRAIMQHRHRVREPEKVHLPGRAIAVHIRMKLCRRRWRRASRRLSRRRPMPRPSRRRLMLTLSLRRRWMLSCCSGGWRGRAHGAHLLAHLQRQQDGVHACGHVDGARHVAHQTYSVHVRAHPEVRSRLPLHHRPQCVRKTVSTRRERGTARKTRCDST